MEYSSMEHKKPVEHSHWLKLHEYRPLVNKLSLMISDLIALFFAVCAMLIVRYLRGVLDLSEHHDHFISNEVNRLLFIAGLFLSGILWFWGKFRHYTYRKPFWSELKEILQTLSLLALLDVAALAFLKQDFSRINWLLLWTGAFLLVPLCRVLTKTLLSKMGFWQQPCVIVGVGENACEAYSAVASDRLMGIVVKAFVAPDNAMSQSPVDGIPLIHADDYWRICAGKANVYLALDLEQDKLRDDWVRKLSTKGIRNIAVIPSLRGIPLYGTDVSHFFSHEVMILRLRNNLAKISSRVIKRVFDLILSFLLLVILSPLFAYLSFKIRRDGGSATYGHERIGQNGKPFKCLKFRSMVVNSQEVLAELLACDPEAKAEWDQYFKLKNDPRITPIGQFIRKTSLDELPQLWNVLKGEMSLVGPRPIVQEELCRYEDDVEYYLMAKPGMTGLWQVSGRSNTDYSTRVYFDSWYVKNWSLWYDVAILFKTAKVVLVREGAY